MDKIIVIGWLLIIFSLVIGETIRGILREKNDCTVLRSDERLEPEFYIRSIPGGTDTTFIYRLNPE